MTSCARTSSGKFTRRTSGSRKWTATASESTSQGAHVDRELTHLTDEVPAGLPEQCHSSGGILGCIVRTEVLEGNDAFQAQLPCRRPVQGRTPHDCPHGSSFRPRADSGNELAVRRLSVKASFAGDEQIGFPHLVIESKEIQEVVRSGHERPAQEEEPESDSSGAAGAGTVCQCFWIEDRDAPACLDQC